MTARRDPRGHDYGYVYDADGRLLRDDDPAGGFIALARSGNPDGFHVTRTSAEGRVWGYDLTVRADAAEQRTNSGTDGLVTRSVESAATVAFFLPDGGVTATTQAPDPRFSGQASLPASITATTPSGLRMTLARSRAAVLSDPADPLSLSRLTESLSVNGRTWTQQYEAATRLLTATTPAGRTSTTTLDTKGRIAASAIPGLAATSYSYDARGRLATVSTGSRQFTFAYNTRNELTGITDPLSRTVGFSYDDAGRVVTQQLPDGRVIGFRYDPNGNLLAVTPPGRPEHTFDYTTVDLTSRYGPPVTPATEYVYNRDRQLTLIRRADTSQLSIGYDGAGRVAAVTAPTGTYRYAYAPTTGAIASVTAPDGGVVSYTLDGSLLKQTRWTGAVAGAVDYGYDNDFRVVAENGTSFVYDADGLLVQAGALTLSRDPANGLVTGTALGSVSELFTYNGFGEVTAASAAYSGSPLTSFSYTRDAAGRITTVNESVAGLARTIEYGYDTAGRLTSATYNGTVAVSYTYDANSNRLTHTSGSVTDTATYDADDRMLTYAGASYSYTASGELATKTDATGTTAYSYDALGNLRKVVLPGGPTIEYVIDGQNRRIGRKVNGVLTQAWLYADQLRIVAELDAAGATTSRFIYGSRTNVPDSMVKSGVTYRILSDHLGSPRAVVKVADGSVVQRMTYDELGGVISDTATGFQPFGFAGGLYDPATSLVRFGARDYYAGAGRWTAKESLGFAGGDTNFYAYAFSDPINLIDPDGLKVHPANFVGPLQSGDSRSYAANLSDPRLMPLQYPTYGVAPNYFYPAGTPANLRQECVSLTKAFSGAPCTACWRAGLPAVGGNLPPGAAIATFVNGRYPQGDVAKNSGIYLSPSPNGIVMIDQWPGNLGRAREVRSGGGPGRSNDANAYSQITAPAGECGCGGN